MCSTQRCVAAVVERPVEAANWQVEERREGHRVPMRSEGCRQLVRVVLKPTRHGGKAFPSSVLGSGITVPDPNPPRDDAHGGAPGEGVVVGRVRPPVRLLRRARPQGRPKHSRRPNSPRNPPLPAAETGNADLARATFQAPWAREGARAGALEGVRQRAMARL